MSGDILTVANDQQNQKDLLVPAMRQGQRIAPSTGLAVMREHVRDELARLPDPLRRLEPAPPYPVAVSEALQSLALTADRAAGLLP